MQPFDMLRGGSTIGLPNREAQQRMQDDRTWAPHRGTSYVEFEKIDEAFHRDVRAALAELVEEEPGLSAYYLGESGPNACMPWLTWKNTGSEGYWVSFGIEHRGAWPAAGQRSWMSVAYTVKIDDGDRTDSATLLDLYLSGPSSRDGHMMAAMAVDAVRRHGKAIGVA